MTKAFTKAHGITVKAGNYIAGAYVKYVQYMLLKSNTRCNESLKLKQDVVASVGNTLDREYRVQKNLRNELKEAQKMINA